MDQIVNELFQSEPASQPADPSPMSPGSPEPPQSLQPAAPSLETWELPAEPEAQQQAAPQIPPAAEPVTEPPVAEAPVAPGLPTGLQTYIETYGAENVDALTSMAFGLMGIGEIPEGKTPQAHFLDQIYGFDERAYNALVREVVQFHRDDLVRTLREDVLRAEGLPVTAEELTGLRDYARFGHQYVADEAGRQFLQQIPAELQGAFQRLSQVRRDWMVNQVTDGYMPKEVAIEDLKRAEDDYQRDLKQQQGNQEKLAQAERQVEQRAYQQTEQLLSEQKEAIIQAKAKADNLHPEIVRDIYARAGQELEQLANAALYGYSKNEQEHALGVRAIRSYQALVEANKTGSSLAVKQALNDLRLLAEQQYSVHLQQRRQRASQPPPTNGAPLQQQPQTRVLEPEQSARPGSMRLPNGQELVEVLFT